MKEIIWIHHVQDIWLDNNSTPVATEDYLDNIKDFILSKKDDIDTVLFTNFEGSEADDSQNDIIYFLNSLNINFEMKEYAYGWIRNTNNDSLLEYFPDDKKDVEWCFGTRDHHTQDEPEQDILLIEEWMYEIFKGNKTTLFGGFENECILDAETVLDTIGADYEKIPELTLGSGQEINYKNILEEKLNQHLAKLNSFIFDKILNIEDGLREDIETIAYNLNLELDFAENSEILIQIDPNAKSEIEEMIENIKEETAYEHFQIDNLSTAEKYSEIYFLLDCDFDYFEDKSNTFSFYSEHQELFEEVNINDITDIEEFFDRFSVKGVDILNNIKNNKNINELTENNSIDAFDFIFDDIMNKNPEDLYQEYIESKSLSVNSDHYHGSYLDTDSNESIFDFINLKTDFSDHECFYLSNSEKVALWFSERNTNDTFIPIVIKIPEYQQDNIYVIDENSKTLKIEGSEYCVAGDREEYFDHLKSLGYNGCIIENNYGHDESDLALFHDLDLTDLNPQVKYFKNNQWSEYMNLDDLDKKLNQSKTKKLKISA